MALRAGWIVISTRQIARKYSNPDIRVAVIRAQNWATRELARSFFSLPLFNNYTSVLTGSIIINPKLSLKNELILISGVLADYGLKLDSSQDWSTSSRRKFQLKTIYLLIQTAKRLPLFVRIPLKSLVKWAIKF